MDREILFRGKRVDNGEWISGDLITTPFIRNETQQNIVYILDITKADYDCFEDLTEENGIFEVDRKTVCQYTGLSYKYGKRIFEGDICKFFDNSYCVDLTGVVKFGEYSQDGSGGEYKLTPVIGVYAEICTNENYPEWNRTISLLEAMHLEGFEVIGNIFDNPELTEIKGNGRQERLIKLPCMAGDKVWDIDGDVIEPCTITRIILYDAKDENGMPEFKMDIRYDRRECLFTATEAWRRDIGKKFFFSQKEAENALRRMEGAHEEEKEQPETDYANAAAAAGTSYGQKQAAEYAAQVKIGQVPEGYRKAGEFTRKKWEEDL